MGTNLVQIAIVDNRSFLDACDLLHDARLDLSSVQFDPQVGSWKGIFEREFLEDESLITSEPKLLFLKRFTYPFAETELVLHGIKNYRVEDRSEIGTYSFDDLKIKGDEYIFKYSEALTISFTFQEQPLGCLTDRKLLEKRGSFFSFKHRAKLR